ncbi:MAG TPA: hypothetical protein VMR95_04550 [Candidatus Binatia bacterium]|nr:hypothetical protein [Candidatus Binatia bacterium]
MPPVSQNPSPVVSSGQAAPNPANYDFLLNPAPVPKKPLLNLSNVSFTKRIIIIIGGVFGLIILLVIVSSILGGGSAPTPIIVVAQDQNELVRVATEANGQATLQTTQNLGQEVELSLTSAQQQLLAFLETGGKKIGTSQLTATKDVSTDQELTSATAASDFDTVFAQIMQTELQSYVRNIATAYSTVGPNGKALLKSEYNSGKVLLTMANSTLSSLPSQ